MSFFSFVLLINVLAGYFTVTYKSISDFTYLVCGIRGVLLFYYVIIF